MTFRHHRSRFVLALALSAIGLATGPAAAQAPSAHDNFYARADLRNLAVAEETYLTDHGRYGSFRQLSHGGDSVAVSRGVTLRIRHYDKSVGYCLAAVTTHHRHFIYDSQAGGIHRRKHCITTVDGPSGGVRRGPSSS
jgi:hypothetical protein